MTTNRKFKDDHDDSKAYLVSGRTLNGLGDSLNQINAGFGIQRGLSGLNTAGIKTDIPAPPFLFGIAVITSATDKCEKTDDELDEKDFPCRSVNKYLAELRVFESDTGKWVKYGDEIKIESSVYFEDEDSEASAKSSGWDKNGPHGPMPRFEIGDVVPVYFDILRNKWLVVTSPVDDMPYFLFNNDEDINLTEGRYQYTTNNASPVLECYLERYRPDIDKDENGTPNFVPIATLSFPLSYKFNGTAYDCRSTFTMTPCPHGTQFRVRYCMGVSPDDGMVVKIWHQRISFIGSGRRVPNRSYAEDIKEESFTGGQASPDFAKKETTWHRFVDAPDFNVVTSDSASTQGLIQCTYHDKKDEWMIGVDFHVAIRIENDYDQCVKFVNRSQEIIPANAVMRVADGTSTKQKTVFNAYKPNSTFQRFYLVNTGKDVAPDAIGCGQWLDEAGQVLFDAGSSGQQYTPGESWGAKTGSWRLFKNRPGFTFMGGIIDANKETARFSAIQYQVNNLKAKSDSSLSKNQAFDINVWMRNSTTGAWEKSEYKINAYPMGGELTKDLFLAVEWDCGQWITACLEQ